MNILEIEELRNVYLNRKEEDLEDKDVSDLHKELHPLIKHREDLEKAKKIYSSKVNETLKLVKARLSEVTRLIDLN